MKFTIITVTYNAEHTLERTLRSVAEQTYPHIEHILIDGASKDRTLEIARTHGKHLANIVSEPDKGLYDAMNKGLKLATGEYVCFLNAGDKLHAADTLEKVYHEVQAALNPSHPTGEERRNDAKAVDKAVLTHAERLEELPGVLYGHTDIVDDNGHYLGPRHLTPPDRLNWRSFKQGMLVCHQAFYARRDLCVTYDTTFRFSSDFDWCIRVMKQTDKLQHLPFTVCDYLQEGMTTRNHRASLIERFRLMCRHYGRCSTLCHHLWFALRALCRVNN